MYARISMIYKFGSLYTIQESLDRFEVAKLTVEDHSRSSETSVSIKNRHENLLTFNSNYTV